MKKAIVTVLIPAVVLIFIALGERPTSATSAIDQAFDSRYGAELTGKYGCGLCHGGSFTEFNPYGQDLMDAMVGGGARLQFYPPNTHTIPKGRFGYKHADGLFTPYSSGCTRCHGVDLKGLIAPSCYLCHGERWTEGTASTPVETNAPAQQGLDEAFAAIENNDSDGDGFSNIDEINALTHPGDPNSFPGGGEVEVSVDMEKFWDRDWVTAAGLLEVTVIPRGGSLEMARYVALKTDAGELFSTRLRNRGKRIIAVFPKALLHLLFSDPADRSASLLVSGETADGFSFSAKFRVRQQGAAPALLEDISAKVDPDTWEDDETGLSFTLRGAGNVDVEKPVYVVGPFLRVELQNVVRSGQTVTGELDAETAVTMMGSPVKGVIYTVGLYGSSTEPGTSFAAAVDITSLATDCYDFDPPNDHTVPFTRGECTYYHKPGYRTPYAEGCYICHGSDLRGTSVTPSCYLCHGQLWSASAPADHGS